MATSSERLVPVTLEEEMRSSYIDYSMSVIVQRALPDVRDGLKPVHRRVLFAMSELSLGHNRPYKKCARIVGETMGKYHPHGDSSIYDTLVRMAQDFSMRHQLVDGQGNFGCFTGDTRIKLLDGTERSFAELAELGPDARFHVYSVDKAGMIVVGEGRNARITRCSAELVEVILDNGGRIRCTPDHRFMLRNGSYKEAQHLTPDDSLMPGYFDTAPVKVGLNPYLRIQQPSTGTYEFVHVLADRYNAQQGTARTFPGAFVRHHSNFNRWDNRPANIERMEFLEHLHVHAEHIAELWQSEEFRTAQRNGVRRFYDTNPEVRQARRENFVRQNKDGVFRKENGKRIGALLRARYAANPEAREVLSVRMKRLWADPDYRERMSRALKGIDRRPLTSEQRMNVSAIISQKSREMWGDPGKRSEIVAAISRAMADPAVRARISSGVRSAWASPSYRAKFGTEHFSRMANALWNRPEIRMQHQEKILAQWADPVFREAQRNAVRRSNASRMKQNPAMMKRLAEQAAVSLRVRWQDPEYRQNVLRQKISRYGSTLIARIGRDNLTPESYEQNRNAAWIPKLSTALSYFGSFDNLVEASSRYNHRIVSVNAISDMEDVYDITVDEHHNFLLADGVFVHNSVDGDPAAAMRYTEARLTAIAGELLRDIDKNTVHFVPNFDDSLQQPSVLPASIPNLLVNGSTGIAVGMATNIPPHNLGEIVDGLVAMIAEPEITNEELMVHVKAPDFPTGGIIYGYDGVAEAYRTGRGRVVMRARVNTEVMKSGKEQLVVSELPYQVNKANLIEKIAHLVRDKKLEDISNIRDESDRDGLRVVIELKRDATPEVVMNNLYKYTALQQTFGVIMLALVDGRPRVLTLRDMMHYYLEHRNEVVVRRTQFDLDAAERRAHILEGYIIALDNIDEVIALIKKSKDVESARHGLIKRFGLSEIQAKAILDMRLQRLTGLERTKIEEEYRELLQLIEKLKSILASKELQMHIIREELLEIKTKYGEPRRTDVIYDYKDFTLEELIAQEDVVVTISHNNFIKRFPVSGYRRQIRGGKGVTGMQTREDDFIEHVFVGSTHNYLVFFTDRGRCFRLKIYEIPEAGRAAKGRSLANLLPKEKDENITAILAVKDFSLDQSIIMVTERGTVKKTALSDFANIRSTGIIAINLANGDRLVATRLTDGDNDILIATRLGMAVRFRESDVRDMGRTAAGVRGVTLAEEDRVIEMVAVKRADSNLLVVSENGYGKRSQVADFRLTKRGGKGVISMNTTDKVGYVVAMKEVVDGDDIVVMTEGGMVIRQHVAEIRVLGRNTQGVKLIRLNPKDRITGVAVVPSEEDDDEAIGLEGSDTDAASGIEPANGVASESNGTAAE